MDASKRRGDADNWRAGIEMRRRLRLDAWGHGDLMLEGGRGDTAAKAGARCRNVSGVRSVVDCALGVGDERETGERGSDD